MTGINHVTTGVLISTAVNQPVAALSLAFVSHFLLDIMPHFGGKQIKARSLLFSSVLSIDIILLLSLAVYLLVWQPAGWGLMFAAGFVSLAPDFMWFPNYFRDISGKERKPYRGIAAVHKRIQWAEVPWGGFVEIIWLIVFGSLLIKQL